jgi:flagellar hook-associated protein 3 FlgL
MRVTFRALHQGAEYVNAAAADLARARQQVESGKRLHAPSDDPPATLRAIEGHAEIGALDSYARTADTVTARLARFDAVLGDVVERLTQANVAAASARGTTATTASREAAAVALEGLRDDLVANFNTSFHGVHLFSGSQVQAAAYARVGGVWTYQGNTATVSADLGQGRSAMLTLNGQAIAQGSDASDLFTEMDALIAAVRAGDDAAIGVGMDALQRAFDRATRAQSQVGADQQGVASRQLQISATRLATAARLSKDEDADMVAAITAMQQADTAYRAALGAVATASRLSLLDYLGPA